MRPASLDDDTPSGFDTPDPDADWSLPAWLYTDPEYFAVETERIIRPSWQIVCHESDIAEAGTYQTLDYLGESVIAVRGADGVIRAFHNVCRHRAMRLVEGPMGCVRKLTCPYHAWTYELDGRLSGVPSKGDYPALRLEGYGLAPVAVELWRGFVFVRTQPGPFPSVAAMMAPYEAEIAPYRVEAMRSLAPVRLRERAVNWKQVGDNYSDNLHIPVAHDGLSRLFGRSYAIEAQPWVDKMSGAIDDGLQGSRRGNFWERFYRAHLPRAEHLPETSQRRWLYF
jgi:phenylpropionate dioxygenase-like ring-hydroxylating dioxygenase large terminal subunit